VSYDLVVVGLGAMGSAALDSATRRGLSVLGVEQFAPGHALGSSHGKSRMIRKAYFEDAAYVPLVLRAYELWHDLERRSGRTLLQRTGVLQVGLEKSAVVRGVQRSASLHGLAIDVLDAGDVRRRYPMTRPLPEEVGVFEHDGGVLAPELALDTQIALAIDAGAEARFDARVVRWRRESTSLCVEFASGDVVRTRKLALCNGPWLDARATELGVPIRVQRKVQVWFEPATDAFDAARCPAFLVERAAFPETLYGFPDFGDGVKAAFHTGGAFTTMDALDRSISDDDVSPLRAALQSWMPGAGERVSAASVCQYTMTPDEHFILGLHPGEPDVVVAAGFSGHGFKFSTAIGEAIVDLATDGATKCDVAFLSPNRL
jgi:sarcosine oxidase